ncbi:MAG: hypothetical protein FWD89_00465 [Firmicutes bacterium]|nr:hypothetical protein [Bacillota bacterium]MCL2770772.1 hypothetical protein [Bacillota bacterium]
MNYLVKTKSYIDGELFMGDNFEVGNKVVVDLNSAQFLGEVASKAKGRADKTNFVVRVATKDDIAIDSENQERAKESLKRAKTIALNFKLDLKLLDAEYSLDQSKLIITFISEERVDFRAYVKDLAQKLKTRIELKQIGARDEVSLVGALGACGQICCCVRKFGKMGACNNGCRAGECGATCGKFPAVSVKMAKTQGLSLAPNKINGMCGRLLCCLAYEQEDYDITLAKMPKLNTQIKTPDGVGTVASVNAVKETVSVKFWNEDSKLTRFEEYTLEDLGAPMPAPQASEAPKKPEENSQNKKHNFFNKNKDRKNQQPQKQNNNKENKKPKIFNIRIGPKKEG